MFEVGYDFNKIIDNKMNMKWIASQKIGDML